MFCLFATILLTLTVALPVVNAKPGTGVPFQMLQDQIDEVADAVSGNDKSVVVDCTVGSISDALAGAPPGGRLIITVEGNCAEDVTITRDDVTLQGGSGVVDGQITIDGAQRVVIDGLTVTGVRGGIEAVRNAAVTVQNSAIEHNDSTGIAVRQGAFALIDGNTISSNGECEVVATDSGNVRMLNNTIVSNQPDAGTCGAVGAYRNSMIRMRGGNTVTQEALSGLALDVEHGSTFRQDGGRDTIMGKVQVLNMSNADFRNVNIFGDIDLLQISVLRMRNPSSDPLNVTVIGDININQPNLARFSNPMAVIDGNINCYGGLLFGFPILINSPPNMINCFPPPPLPPPLPAP
jgi:hypothetical protein